MHIWLTSVEVDVQSLQVWKLGEELVIQAKVANIGGLLRWHMALSKSCSYISSHLLDVRSPYHSAVGRRGTWWQPYNT